MWRKPTSQTQARSDAMPANRRTRVLIVEDDLACRILSALLLEQDGYVPTAVPTVARALERLDVEGTDVVLTEPADAGRERPRSPPDLGAQTVIQKPFSAEWRCAAVGAALEQLPAVA
jgi:hypothetical protein